MLLCFIYTSYVLSVIERKSTTNQFLGGIFLSCTEDAWSPRHQLVDIIKALVDVVDYPSVDYPINRGKFITIQAPCTDVKFVEAAEQYTSQKAQFNRKVSQMIEKHGLPRD